MKAVTCKFCKHERNVLDADEIYFFRRRHKLTLKALAKITGTSVSFISDCEHNRRNLSFYTSAIMQQYELRNMLSKKGKEAK